MQRFFVSFPLSIDVKLTDMDMIHQFTRVLRIAPGEHVILFDGDMSETEYEIVSIEKKSISLKGVARTFPQREPQKCITLYQALPNKVEKIEYILQK
jgi:16S rRNA (uracil1498-N3)-methyltransferase